MVLNPVPVALKYFEYQSLRECVGWSWVDR